MIDPAQLQHELGLRGLTVLAVTRDQRHNQVLVVYLHGNAGQWVAGHAVRVIRAVPGVATAVESPRQPAIILVRTTP